MNNQLILWSILILPWLTLFFMRKEDIKRFMPVALFTAITSMIIVEVAGTLNLWALRETIFPLSHTLPIVLSLMPVITMWLFKFTYGRFLRYISIDAVLNLGFAFIMNPWLIARGIREDILATNSTHFFITTIHGLLLYAYQLWQEDALVPAVKNHFSTRIQPAATKPVLTDEDHKKNTR